MLPELYRTYLQSQLSVSQLHTLEILVWLLQFQKQVRIERLAAGLPLPILFESRRRHLQRFLILPQLSVALIWLPLIQGIIRTQIKSGNQVILTLDRTQWRTSNLLMVSVIWSKRAWPVYWQFMPKKGSSNLDQQKAILRPALRLLKSEQVVVVGDREFHSIKRCELARRAEGILCVQTEKNHIYQIKRSRLPAIKSAGIEIRKQAIFDRGYSH